MIDEYFQKFNRFWELDFYRGIALIVMIIFHLLFDLNYFIGTHYNLYSGFFYWFGKFASISFLFLVGISLTISHKKTCKNLDTFFLAKKYTSRGLKIFILGLIITLVTYLITPNETILFGVLHLIGLSIILSFPLLNFKKLNLMLGLTIIIIGLWIRRFAFDFSQLFWIGFIPTGFTSFDYFPLFPWFGIILIGLWFGNKFYEKNSRNFKINNFENNWFNEKICFLGRTSLLIYFLHQPILIGLIFLIKLILT